MGPCATAWVHTHGTSPARSQFLSPGVGAGGGKGEEKEETKPLTVGLNDATGVPDEEGA